MTLEEKLKNINKTSTLMSLNSYPAIETAKDLEELWIKVIEPNLPNKNTVINWHNILMDYIKQENVAFSLRRFGSHSKKEDSLALRRGFLNKVFLNTKEVFKTFYVDNGFTAYFYSMAKDGYAPTDVAEFKNLIDNFEFPCGYFQTGVEGSLAAYKKGNNPKISDKGYKIAHIFSAGEGYNDAAGYAKIGDFCKSVFPRGDRNEWRKNVLPAGQHYRPIYLTDSVEVEKIKKFAIAHFIRTIHPINYFLVPNKTNTRDKATGVIKTNIYWYNPDTCKEMDEIGENLKLIEFVASKIKDIYKDTNVYQEFLDLIYPTGPCIAPKENNVNIDARYALGIWKEKAGTSAITAKGISGGIGGKTVATSTKNKIDLDKINDKAYLQTFKVGEIANQVLRVLIEKGIATGLITKAEIKELKTKRGKKGSLFMLTLPVLLSDRKDMEGRDRAYKKPLNYSAEVLYLNSQWPKSDIEIKNNLIDWIVNRVNVYYIKDGKVSFDCNPFAVFDEKMKKSGLKSGRAYVNLIKKIMKEMGISTIEELNNRIDEAIIYCETMLQKARDKKESKKYRDARAALRKYRELLDRNDFYEKEGCTQQDFDESWIKDLYIRYDTGWQSFRSKGEYVATYTIIGDHIIAGTNVCFNSGNTYGIKIGRGYMLELLSILNEAYRYDIFADSNTCIKTIHGKISSYEYSYRDKKGIDCNGLFKDSRWTNSLQTRYIDLIKKLTKL